MIRRRLQNIELIAQQEYDLVVIGGGITGAGIALAASKRGWKVLIIDKGDFSSGTSSKSAKMIHGGLRYLEHLEFKLVGEALHEREHLLNEYPHLVHPQPFFMPIYTRFNLIKLRMGLTSYDLLTGKSSLPKFKQINKKEIQNLFPQIKTEKIVGGFIYYDAKTNDARLTNEVIQQAVDLGAVALNYFELKTIHTAYSSVSHITCVNRLTKTSHNIQSKVFISATGIWTGDVLRKLNASDSKKYMMPSKGIHIAVSADQLPENAVWIIPTAKKDGRMIWCMPWENNLNIIGATDTDYQNDKDDIPVLRDEVLYLLDSVNAQLKGKTLKEEDIMSVFAGLRPLLNDDDLKKKSNERSRDYHIWWNNDNMLTISGGKFTSFLSMAESCVKEIEKKTKFKKSKINSKQRSRTNHPNSILFEEDYGKSNAALIAAIANEDECLLENIKGTIYTSAEIIFYVRHQHALKIGDVLTRRTSITYQMKDFDEILVHTTAQIMAKELNWSLDELNKEVLIYKTEWDSMHSWQ